MAERKVNTAGRKKKTDWQLFTNDGKFDSKLPPSQRLRRLKGFKVLWIPTAKPTTPKNTKPQPQVENVENFIVVWLDQSIDNTQCNPQSQSQVKQVVNSVKIFPDPEECHTFMSSVKDVKIFVIVSGTIRENFVSSIHDEKQLESIYILSADNSEEPWIRQYPEIRGVYTTIQSLCQQLGTDAKRLDHYLLGFEVMGSSSSNTTSKTNQQEALFMYDQLFRDIVLTVPDESMQDMFEFCEKQYGDSPKDQLFLKNLKKQYRSQSPAWWYSQEAFLYRMLNKALRTHEYDILYVLRVFIRHLHEQLVAKHKEENIGDRKLYRGQGLDKEDFEQIRTKTGGLLSISNFLSTTTEREVGLQFARGALNDKKRVSIMMEITVDKNMVVPVANISDNSVFEDEKEWLSSMGSVFRIGSLECLPEGIWVLQLTLTNEQDEKLNALKEHFKQSMLDKNTCFSFAKLMHQIAAWRKSEYFYMMALRTETTQQRRSILYNDLAIIKGELKLYDEALHYYHESLKLKQAGGSNKKVDYSTTYNNIGTVYYAQNKNNLAIEYFQKAIDASNSQEKKNEKLAATLHTNIGSILADEGKYEEALKKCEEALDIRRKIFPEIHPDVANSYGIIANVQNSMGLHAKAIETVQKALDIDRQALPPDHPQTLSHMRNLEIYKKYQNNQQKHGGHK